MSAMLDTEDVPRAMLAMVDDAPEGPQRARPKRPCKRAARNNRRWTQSEVTVLLREWGEVSERKLRARLPGRTWGAIAQQARKHGLPAPSRGKVSVQAAADHIGLHRVTLTRILNLSCVQVVHHVRGSTISRRRRGNYRWLRVDLARAVKAVESYDRLRGVLLTNEQAADHCGVDKTTMKWALDRLAATRPVDGMPPRRAWSVSPADAESAMALYREQKANERAARIAAGGRR